MLFKSAMLTDLIEAAKGARIDYVASQSKVGQTPTVRAMMEVEFSAGIEYGLNIAVQMVNIKFPVSIQPSIN